MHAVASEGRLQDVSREYQLITSGGSSLPSQQLSLATGRILRRADDSYAVGGRPSTKETWSSLTDDSAAASRASGGLSAAPLQRLERLESELASLNHARRRLAVDGDLEAGAASSRHLSLTGQATVLDGHQGDAEQPVDWSHHSAAPRGGIAGDVEEVCDVIFICIDDIVISSLIWSRIFRLIHLLVSV